MKNRSLIVALTLVLLGTSGSSLGVETKQPHQSFIKRVVKKVKEVTTSPKFLIPAAVVGVGVLAVAGWYYASKKAHQSSFSTWSDQRRVLTRAEYLEHKKMIDKLHSVYWSRERDEVQAAARYELAGAMLYWIEEPARDGKFIKHCDNLPMVKDRYFLYQKYLKEADDLGHEGAKNKLAGPLPDVFKGLVTKK